jgi:PASTA domain
MKLGASLACLLCAGIIAACGSDNSGDSASQTGAVTTSATAPPATATGPAATVPATVPAPPAGAPIGKGTSNTPPANAPLVRIPNVTGQSLAAAQKALAAAGLTGTAEALNGDRTQIRSNWEVCKTVPAGGKRAPGDSPITLITAAPGGC